MQKKSKFFYIFLIFLLASVFFLLLSRIGLFKGTFFVSLFSPIQKEIHKNYISFVVFTSGPDKEQLKQENMDLVKIIVNQKKLEDQNTALLDQFQTSYPKSFNLIPAEVIGAPGFIPGLSVPEKLILNKGKKDGAKKGNTVIIKDNLIGRVEKVSNVSSIVSLITNDSSVFAVKVGIDKNILGTVKGQGIGEMILDNVLLSDNLKKDDIVLTKGDLEEDGSGYLPNLIVGKVVSVNKSSSALFQKGDVISFVDFSKLSTVFIITQK
jgi:rod shape-determining protein MreC